MPEQAFPALATPFASAGGRIIASPFQFVADVDTFVRVVSVCSASGVVLSVQGRRLDDRGQLQVITEKHTPASNRTTTTTTFAIGAGAILNLTVFASSGAPLIGQCYVMVQLLRSSGATAIVLGTLLGGYVTATQALGFPGSPVVTSLEGEPVVRAITGTTPALGANWNETVPTGARWEVLRVSAQLATNATAGGRLPVLVLDDGSNLNTVVPFTPGQDPGVTGIWTWAPNLPYGLDTVLWFLCGPMPSSAILLAGHRMRVSTGNMAAGDQWSSPKYVVREWLEVT